MGQKTHPHGLRIGIHKKWDSNWFGTDKNYKSIFFSQQQVEQVLKSFFHFYPYTKISTVKRVLLVDTKIYKYKTNQLYIFIFFYKFRTKKRKESFKTFHHNKEVNTFILKKSNKQF